MATVIDGYNVTDYFNNGKEIVIVIDDIASKYKKENKSRN